MDRAVCISLRANALGEDKNPFLLPSHDQLWGNSQIVILGLTFRSLRQSKRPKRRDLNQLYSTLKLTLCQFLPLMVGLGKFIHDVMVNGLISQTATDQ